MDNWTHTSYLSWNHMFIYTSAHNAPHKSHKTFYPIFKFVYVEQMLSHEDGATGHHHCVVAAVMGHGSQLRRRRGMGSSKVQA
jgi:hypothetical protein